MGGDDLSVDAWTVIGSIFTVIGVIVSFVLGVIPLVRERNKASTAYAPPPTASGAPQPIRTVASKAPVSAPAPATAGPVHPANSPESRRGIGLRGVIWSLLPFLSFILAAAVDPYLKGEGFHGRLAWFGILAAFLMLVPFVHAGIRLRSYKLVFTGLVYGLVSLILWIIVVAEDHAYYTGGYSETTNTYIGGLGFSLLGLSVVGTIHAFWLRRRVFARST